MGAALGGSEGNPPSSAPASPAPAGPRSPWYRRRRVLVTIAVAAGLLAAGLLVYEAERPKTAAGPSGPLTFDQAASIAQSSASHYASGSWTPVAGFAALATFSIPIPLGQLGSNLTSLAQSSNCTLSWPQAPRNLTLPAYTGAIERGVSPDWWLVLAEAGGGLLVVAVLNATAVPLVAIGGVCASFGAYLSPVGGATTDSPAIAASAQSHGGSAFLLQHPGAIVTMAVTGGFPLLGLAAEWNVTYSSCDPLGPIGASSSLSLSFNAANGALLSEHNATVNCSLPTKLPPGTILTTPALPPSPSMAAVTVRP